MTSVRLCTHTQTPISTSYYTNCNIQYMYYVWILRVDCASNCNGQRFPTLRRVFSLHDSTLPLVDLWASDCKQSKWQHDWLYPGFPFLHQPYEYYIHMYIQKNKYVYIYNIYIYIRKWYVYNIIYICVCGPWPIFMINRIFVGQPLNCQVTWSVPRCSYGDAPVYTTGVVGREIRKWCLGRQKKIGEWVSNCRFSSILMDFGGFSWILMD